MAKSLPAVNTEADTFYAWVLKFNTLITLANTEIVTANTHVNGAVTTGNGYVIGTLGANTLVATNIRGGNTVANGVLTITSNTIFTDSVVKINSGASYGANAIVHDHGLRTVTSGLTAQAVDSFAIGTYRSAKYVISVTDPTNSDYQVTEILLIHDGTATYTTEYATIVTDAALATFSSDVTGGNVRLLINPLFTPLQVNVSRTLVSV
jgi:hypothetical protein